MRLEGSWSHGHGGSTQALGPNDPPIQGFTHCILPGTRNRGNKEPSVKHSPNVSCMDKPLSNHTSNYTYHDWTLCHCRFTSIVCTSTNMTQHITDKIFLKFTSYRQEGCNWRLYLRTPDLLTDTNFCSEVKKEDTWPFLPAPFKLLLPQVLQVHLLLLAIGWTTSC